MQGVLGPQTIKPWLVSHNRAQDLAHLRWDRPHEELSKFLHWGERVCQFLNIDGVGLSWIHSHLWGKLEEVVRWGIWRKLYYWLTPLHHNMCLLLLLHLLLLQLSLLLLKLLLKFELFHLSSELLLAILLQLLFFLSCLHFLSGPFFFIPYFLFSLLHKF